MSKHLVLPKSFLEALWQRIDEVRPNLDSKLPKLALKGYRFKDNSIIRSTVIGMVGIAKNGDIDDYVLLQRLRGLNADRRDFNENEVVTGLYDTLIEKALTSAAEMDYMTSTDPKLH